MTKNNKKIILIEVLLLIFVIVTILFLKPDCLFKKYIGIPCPGCGITRGLKALFTMKYLEVFKYNILTIPLAILIFCMMFLTFKDVLLKQNNVSQFYDRYIVKNYRIIIIILIVSWLVNIYRQI